MWTQLKAIIQDIKVHGEKRGVKGMERKATEKILPAETQKMSKDSVLI